MSSIVEIACALLLAIGLVLMIAVYESNAWSQSDTGSVFTQANTMTSGLWEKCSSNADSGTETCATFDSFFLGLPLHLQAARAFTISALVLQSGATLLAIVGVSFCPIGNTDETIRNRLRMIGGVSGGMGGLSIVAAVSWYAVSIMHSYYDAMYLTPDTERLAFGTAIFIGWASGAISILGSLLAFWASCPTTTGRDTDLRQRSGQKAYMYSSNTTQEYV